MNVSRSPKDGKVFSFCKPLSWKKLLWQQRLFDCRISTLNQKYHPGSSHNCGCLLEEVLNRGQATVFSLYVYLYNQTLEPDWNTYEHTSNFECPLQHMQKSLTLTMISNLTPHVMSIKVILSRQYYVCSALLKYPNTLFSHFIILQTHAKTLTFSYQSTPHNP